MTEGDDGIVPDVCENVLAFFDHSRRRCCPHHDQL